MDIGEGRIKVDFNFGKRIKRGDIIELYSRGLTARESSNGRPQHRNVCLMLIVRVVINLWAFFRTWTQSEVCESSVCAHGHLTCVLMTPKFAWLSAWVRHVTSLLVTNTKHTSHHETRARKHRWAQSSLALILIPSSHDAKGLRPLTSPACFQSTRASAATCGVLMRHNND